MHTHVNRGACFRQREAVWEMVNSFFPGLRQETDLVYCRRTFKLQFCKGKTVTWRQTNVHVRTHTREAERFFPSSGPDYFLD